MDWKIVTSFIHITCWASTIDFLIHRSTQWNHILLIRFRVILTSQITHGRRSSLRSLLLLNSTVIGALMSHTEWKKSDKLIYYQCSAAIRCFYWHSLMSMLGNVMQIMLQTVDLFSIQFKWRTKKKRTSFFKTFSWSPSLSLSAFILYI